MTIATLLLVGLLLFYVVLFCMAIVQRDKAQSDLVIARTELRSEQEQTEHLIGLVNQHTYAEKALPPRGELPLIFVAHVFAHTPHGPTWELVGVFTDDEGARAACIDKDHFMGEIALNVPDTRRRYWSFRDNDMNYPCYASREAVSPAPPLHIGQFCHDPNRVPPLRQEETDVPND